MKTVIDDLIRSIKRIKPETIYARSVDQEALDEAVEANKAQLERGELDNDISLANYSRETVARNNKRRTKVSTSDVIKFKDTGNFHRSIKAKITRDGELTLYSRSKKSQYSQDYVDARPDLYEDGSVLGLQEHNLSIWYEQFVEDKFQQMLIDRILNY